MFAIFFVEFWFELARWVDSTILDALYGWTSPHSNLNAFIGLNNTFGDMILSFFVMGTMFLILPALWVTALTWTGIQAGNVLQGLTQGTKPAGEAGGKGFGGVVNIVKK